MLNQVHNTFDKSSHNVINVIQLVRNKFDIPNSTCRYILILYYSGRNSSYDYIDKIALKGFNFYDVNNIDRRST